MTIIIAVTQDPTNTGKIQTKILRVGTGMAFIGIVIPYFSKAKCCYIQVGPPSRSCCHSYMLNSTTVTSTDKQKDLGIWIDPNLNFHSPVIREIGLYDCNRMC